MNAHLAWLLVLPAIAGVGAQPVDPNALGEALGPVLDEVVAPILPQAENETGQDLTSEHINIEAMLEVHNAEYQIIGILFGGGKVQIDARTDLRLEVYAVGMERLDDALRAATGDLNMSVSDTFGVPSHRVALTAEEIRLIGGGVLLTMLQSYLETLTHRLIEDAVPGMLVQRIDYQWRHTLPLERVRNGDLPDLREPPLTLDANMRLQYLDRLALVDIIQQIRDNPKNASDPNEVLQKQIEQNQTTPFRYRSAFGVFGYHQLLAFTVPPGWTINATLQTPAGFTFEAATDEIHVDGEHRTARYVLDGEERTSIASTAAVATLSSRYLVTVVLGVAVFVAGLVMRLIFESILLAHLRSKAGEQEPGTEHSSG